MDGLDPDVDQLRADGIAAARADTEYRIALAKAVREIRNEGVAWGAAQDLARGRPDVAKLRQKKLEAEVIYKASQEALNTHKLATRVLQDTVNKAWSTTGGRYEY